MVKFKHGELKSYYNTMFVACLFYYFYITPKCYKWKGCLLVVVNVHAQSNI